MKKINEWIKLTDEIVDLFLRKYFDDNDPYYTWVTMGGVFNYGDYWFDFPTVLDCYRLEATKEQLINWYDSSLEQRHDLSLEDFILSPQKRKEQEEKYLQELKERVIFAEETFKKALEEYDQRKI
jgi:hypothetical protein